MNSILEFIWTEYAKKKIHPLTIENILITEVGELLTYPMDKTLTAEEVIAINARATELRCSIVRTSDKAVRVIYFSKHIDTNDRAKG